VTSGGTAGDGSVCGNLFLYANPHYGVDSTTAPTDTLQAVFDLVRPPNVSMSAIPQITAIYGTKTVNALSPFQPILTSAPHDWSIALNYTSGGGVGGSGSTGSGSSAFALDASGNLWITNTNTNSVSEWSNLGAPVSPAVLGSSTGGFTPAGLNAPGPIAVDANGYVWVANGNGSLMELDNTATPVNGSPFLGGGLTTPVGMAIDGSGSIWITNSGSIGDIARFSNSGIALSPAAGYVDGLANPLPIAIDRDDDVWVKNENQLQGGSSFTFSKLNGANGSVIVSTSGFPSWAASLRQIAADATGNVWGPSGCGVYEVPAGYTGSTFPAVTDHNSAEMVANPSAVAIDGANRLWVASAGGQGCASGAQSPNVALIDTSNGYAFADQSLSNGPQFLAVDSAGNLWVLLNNNTVTEFVGVASPAVTPLASAVKNKKLGAKP
jgi:ligand-binding sensor domain-containing protein